MTSKRRRRRSKGRCKRRREKRRKRRTTSKVFRICDLRSRASLNIVMLTESGSRTPATGSEREGRWEGRRGGRRGGIGDEEER
eukprot:749724-Hanusia_phi.AAC.3